MNEITATGRALPHHVDIEMSPALATLVASYYETNTEPAFVPIVVREEAAKRVAAVTKALDTPPSLETIMLWLRKVAYATKFQPAPKDFEYRARALLDVCMLEIPACCFSERTQLQAMSTFKDWPAVAEIVALLRGPLATLRIQLRALQGVVDGHCAFFRQWQPPVTEIATTAKRKLTPNEGAKIAAAISRVFANPTMGPTNAESKWGMSDAEKQNNARLRGYIGAKISDGHLRTIWRARLANAIDDQDKAFAQARLDALGDDAAAA